MLLGNRLLPLENDRMAQQELRQLRATPNQDSDVFLPYLLTNLPDIDFFLLTESSSLMNCEHNKSLEKF